MKKSRFVIRAVHDREWIAKIYDPNIEVPHRYYVVFDRVTGYERRNKFATKDLAKAWVLKQERK